jgi:uncharacterized protein involved in exopolysaccharide biosynthesis
VEEQASVAEFENRERRLANANVQAGGARDQLDQVRGDIGAAHARSELLEQRIKDLTHAMNEKSVALAQQGAREDDLEAVLKAARVSYETASQRLADMPVSLGSRTEWLRVVDRGIVPQRPSSPNVPLIVIAAASLAFFGSLLYLTISFSLARHRRIYEPRRRMATHGDD